QKKDAENAVATAEAKIAQKKLLSTIDGIVEKVNTHEGEMSGNNDQQHPGALYVVLNDPLYIEVDLPNEVAQNLKLKQKLEVRYTRAKDWIPAEIVLFPAVADRASNTQRVRLQMPNPEPRRQAGLPVDVRVPDGLVA